ncbi:hypothetical protein A3A67_03465 [Candidatus Peribacteria bacterium RIFCSPLOWO2_01_FULL_51_18]|nr:MAG: hypothetical protein A3A67_03465 [Candidatus Peribacteria bacterium RIFCSPLOWO2_01_FULL_51_18]
MKNKNILTRNGVLVGALILLAFGLWSGFGLLVPAAYAQAGGAGSTVYGSLGGDLTSWLGKLATINTFLHILLLISLDLAGYFLSADFFTSSPMMEALNSIWQLSRDIMNLIFALMLVGVAVYTIITAKSDLIKNKISHFILGVILVNFSWFFPRVIIDVSSVLTATIYSVPHLLPNWSCKTLGPDGLSVVDCKVITKKKIFGSQSEQNAWKGANGCIQPAADPNCPCYENVGCYKLENFNTVGNQTMVASNAMLNGLAVSFVKITTLAKIPQTVSFASIGSVTPAQAAWTSFQTLMSVLITFIIQLAIVLPIFAMAVGFMIRIMILWMTTALMPFTFLGLVLQGKLGTNIGGFEINIWKEFLEAAFMPATVAAPLVIGMIFLSSSVQYTPPDMVVAGTDWTVPIISDIKTAWPLLWMLAAIMIIWIGTFSALRRSKMVGGITDKIKGIGDYIGKGAAQLPLLAPIPLPGGKSVSLGQGLALARAAPGVMQRLVAMPPDERPSLKQAFREQIGLSQTGEIAKRLKDTTNLNKVKQALEQLRGGANRADQIRAIKEAMGEGVIGKTNVETLSLLDEVSRNPNAHEDLRNKGDLIRSELEKERKIANPSK